MKQRSTYKNPARFRLDFIKENTFNRVWSVRMTRARVIIVSLAVILAFAALIWTVIALTPLRLLMPGALKGDLRARYLETALRLDSLEQTARANEAYISSVMAIMKGESDTIAPYEPAAPVADTVLQSGEAERMFVSRYEADERFNLSVLAPIAAEGMIFASPVPSTATVTPKEAGGVTVTQPGVLPVSAVYRGTVTGIFYDSDGRAVVVIQHPNDFVSVYSGVSDVFVAKGARVSASQRIGHTDGGRELVFELWHGGTLLSPQDYVAF